MGLIKVYDTLAEANKQIFSYTIENQNLMNYAYDEKMEELADAGDPIAQKELSDPFGIFPRTYEEKLYIEDQILYMANGIKLTWIFQLRKDNKHRYDFNHGLISSGPDYESTKYMSVPELVKGVKTRMETFDRSILYGATAVPFFFNVAEDVKLNADQRKFGRRAIWNKLKASARNIFADPTETLKNIRSDFSELYDMHTVHWIGLSEKELQEFEDLYKQS